MVGNLEYLETTWKEYKLKLKIPQGFKCPHTYILCRVDTFYALKSLREVECTTALQNEICSCSTWRDLKHVLVCVRRIMWRK